MCIVFVYGCPNSAAKVFFVHIQGTGTRTIPTRSRKSYKNENSSDLRHVPNVHFAMHTSSICNLNMFCCLNCVKFIGDMRNNCYKLKF